MGRIFVWVSALRQSNSGQAQNSLLEELDLRGCQVFTLSEELSLPSGINWINNSSQWGDIALRVEIHAEPEPLQIFYSAYNIERKKHAELLLILLLRQCPSLKSQGSRPDTASILGKLAFCRRIKIPSLEIHVDSLSLQQGGWVRGLGDGLMAWSREVAGVESNQYSSVPASLPSYTSVRIILNNQPYPEQGILVNGNPCVPVDLCDRLGVRYRDAENFYVAYQGIVYTIAASLRDFYLSLRWDNLSQTLLIFSVTSLDRYHLDKIISLGKTSEVQLKLFLKSRHCEAFNPFPDLAKLYREESLSEGVNYDLAFCQMALETNFLRFGQGITSDMHNFAKLSRGDGQGFASFSLARLGVRAHIQHLKAYGSLEPLVLEQVDPRFEQVVRGIAPTVQQLSLRWSADPHYGEKIMALLRQLYEASNFL